MIQCPVGNYYIKAMFDNGNVRVKTELLQKVLLQVSVCELHKDMLKNMLLDFPWNMTNKELSVLVILIFDYFLHQNLQKVTQSYQIMFGKKFCII